MAQGATTEQKQTSAMARGATWSFGKVQGIEDGPMEAMSANNHGPKSHGLCPPCHHGPGGYVLQPDQEIPSMINCRPLTDTGVRACHIFQLCRV